MIIRNQIRDIIINNYLNKPFRFNDIFTYIADNKMNINYKQLRNAIAGMVKYGDLIHHKTNPQKNSFFVASKAIHASRDMIPKTLIRNIEKEKQIVYHNKYDQLIENLNFIPAQNGKKIRGFDSPSGRIIRARNKVYVGCSMEIV
jgi:predicted transcriptional regulator